MPATPMCQHRTNLLQVAAKAAARLIATFGTPRAAFRYRNS